MAASQTSNYMLVIVDCLVENFFTPDISSRVRDLRFQALKRVLKYLQHYEDLGYISELICRIAEKKCQMIMSSSSTADMELIIKPRCPHFNGADFIADQFIVPEEELICWSETSLRAPLNPAGYSRYTALFRQIFPEESKVILDA